jgi:excisionase family DNA binding protein
VAEAAERLGITKEAVRKRIARGTLRADKDPDGTVRVYVPAAPTPSDVVGTSPSEVLVEELRDRLGFV